MPRPYVGRVPGIERLKIPDLNMNDGPYAAHYSPRVTALRRACQCMLTILTVLRARADREGFRCSGEVCPPGSTTQFPSGLTVAHSWDPALFGEWGTAMGEEFAGKGANVQFGPGANIARVANGGRSFEYLRYLFLSVCLCVCLCLILPHSVSLPFSLSNGDLQRRGPLSRICARAYSTEQAALSSPLTSQLAYK